MEERSLHVDVHREDDWFWAQITEWPGCFASGETIIELLEALQEAIALYVTPETGPTASVKLRIDGIELRAGSETPLRPARPETSGGPPQTPRRTKSPHRDWGFGRFDRR